MTWARMEFRLVIEEKTTRTRLARELVGEEGKSDYSCTRSLVDGGGVREKVEGTGSAGEAVASERAQRGWDTTGRDREHALRDGHFSRH